MKYSDILRQMERNGHYGEADELRRSMKQHSCFDHERVSYRSDAADGLPYVNYARDKAEEAYEDIRRKERYEEQQRIEEREELERQERQYREQQAREYYEQQCQEEQEE